MQELLDRLRGEGHADAWIVSINMYAAEAFLQDYVSNVGGPVFQDAEGDPVREALGATIYNLWVVDRSGRIRYAHDAISLPTDEELLEGELRALLDEP